VAVKKTPESLRAEADILERQNREQTHEARSEKLLNSFSKWVMAGVMLMFFVGVVLGAYAIVILGESPDATQEYIMKLAQIVCLGYFVKAFGENIAKIVLSAKPRYQTESQPNKNEEGI
jgi:uncharacterized membrane protein